MPRVNPKPLAYYLTDSDLEPWAVIIGEETDKGNTFVDNIEKADVVVGPHCWRLDPQLGHLEKQWQVMKEGVRAIKYPKKKEEKK